MGYNMKKLNKSKLISIIAAGVLVSVAFTACWLFSLACIGVPISKPNAYKDKAFISCLTEIKNNSSYGVFYESKKKNRQNTFQFATNGYEIVTFSQDIALKNAFNALVRKTVICKYDVRKQKTIAWVNPYH